MGLVASFYSELLGMYHRWKWQNLLLQVKKIWIDANILFAYELLSVCAVVVLKFSNCIIQYSVCKHDDQDIVSQCCSCLSQEKSKSLFCDYNTASNKVFFFLGIIDRLWLVTVSPLCSFSDHLPRQCLDKPRLAKPSEMHGACRESSKKVMLENLLFMCTFTKNWCSIDNPETP